MDHMNTEEGVSLCLQVAVDDGFYGLLGPL
jgi:hypothetical protein